MRYLSVTSVLLLTMLLVACSTGEDSNVQSEETTTTTTTMELSNKEKAVALIESLQTGDATPVGYINPEKYIQHNLGVGDGLAGFGEVMANAPEGGFKAKVVRAFEDGDFVVLHTEYDFFGPKAGFDVFRFEDGKIVEHWDNLIDVAPPNSSGRTQFDGTTAITDQDKTAQNKESREWRVVQKLAVRGNSALNH